ncbi:hypothetical protein SEA_SHAM4_94 [Mycobacterium phage Sham4]|nr:hypothetical protein SEA_JOSELITO_95 [Mycobacterium phage Joselito]QBI97921.1 hypothetical protein SEA_ORANGE_97 [Mycobacterium phage Orange]QBI98465.1 hypothetical protein SEA_MUNCH_96 [Mycobacterium phage Munch]QBI98550.1 hypothetical protein SEA_BUD_90 [Mycobacterium phage Bud]QBP32570.1 hypothetical protein SEA_FIBONACCI_97 [Mycobacterium phage Fibonacci]QGZ16512.1 hypothetical protein SEA_ANEEM_98 [Mycobacterium phage Aneem]UAW09353.1 hypothetical protein SEA_TIMOTHY_97 [Mycobacterium
MNATLKRSKDRKVTNLVNGQGTRPVIANSIGLPSGRGFSCPEATDFCSEICYAGRLEKVYKGVSAVLLHNWEVLSTATFEEMVVLLGEMIAEFVKESDKRKAPKIFRIHWDGDFFSGAYVAAWARVIRDFPDVQFWAYTRVQTAAVFLHSQKLSNLALYFSGDRDNLTIARHLEGMGINIAYVDRTFAEGKAQFPGAVRCPENNGAIELISPEGSACARCGLCVNGRKSVLFSSTEK